MKIQVAIGSATALLWYTAAVAAATPLYEDAFDVPGSRLFHWSCQNLDANGFRIGLVPSGRAAAGTALQLEVDASRVEPGAAWMADVRLELGLGQSLPQGYDPAQCVLSFDARVSEAKPFYVWLSFHDEEYSVLSDLEVMLTPQRANEWTTWILPVSSFDADPGSPFPPGVLPDIHFGLRNDGLPWSEMTWGNDSGNVLAIDNLAYSVVPEPSPIRLALLVVLLVGTACKARRLCPLASQVAQGRA